MHRLLTWISNQSFFSANCSLLDPVFVFVIIAANVTEIFLESILCGLSEQDESYFLPGRNGRSHLHWVRTNKLYSKISTPSFIFARLEMNAKLQSYYINS